ncbi:uncharacterized protein [Dermacentor albipictus]|uniref:uncharacterized protein n=1 Tax=Dermacentor albipictus TaxID=60249 RepID=UPI0038FC5004
MRKRISNAHIRVSLFQQHQFATGFRTALYRLMLAAVTAYLTKAQIFAGEGNLDFYSMWEFEGTDTTSSRPTVLVTDLEPWMYYMASLKGCLGKNCSAAVNTTFRTPPKLLPKPVLVRAVSTSNSSFELAWSFEKDDVRLYNGFRVRYCRTSAASCLQVYTEKQELTVRGLDSGATYDVDVRAQFTITGGWLMIGSPASASVTTWKDLPDIKVTDKAAIPDHVGTYLLRWECVNSDVDYFQVHHHSVWSLSREVNIMQHCDGACRIQVHSTASKLHGTVMATRVSSTSRK